MSTYQELMNINEGKLEQEWDKMCTRVTNIEKASILGQRLGPGFVIMSQLAEKFK